MAKVNQEKLAERNFAGLLKWCLISCTALIVALGLVTTYASASYYKQALPNTYLLGKDIGGLSAENAKALFASTPPYVSGSVKFQVGDQILSATAENLGVTVDLDASIEKAINGQRVRQTLVTPKGLTTLAGQKNRIAPVYTIDQASFESYLHQLCKDLEIDPANAAITVTDGKVAIQEDTDGQKINTDKAYEDLAGYLPEGRIPTINLELVSTPAEIQALALTNAKDYLTKQLPSSIALTYNGKTVATMSLAAVISILDQNKLQSSAIEINTESLNAWITKNVASKVNVSAKPILVSAVNENEIIDQGQVGKTLNQTQLAKDLVSAITAGASAKQINLQVSEVAPARQTVSPGYTPGKYPGKYLEVNLSKQMLYQFEGTNLIGSHRISSGKWSMPTPEGEFTILNKSARAYSSRYDLYMPYWMAFTNQGHGIHELPEWANGTKEGESHLGTPVSHGCVRLGVGAAAAVYNWAEVGTPVYIHS